MFLLCLYFRLQSTSLSESFTQPKDSMDDTKENLSEVGNTVC